MPTPPGAEADRFVVSIYPMGAASFPFGPPGRWEATIGTTGRVPGIINEQLKRWGLPLVNDMRVVSRG